MQQLVAQFVCHAVVTEMVSIPANRIKLQLFVYQLVVTLLKGKLSVQTQMTPSV